MCEKINRTLEQNRKSRDRFNLIDKLNMTKVTFPVSGVKMNSSVKDSAVTG